MRPGVIFPALAFSAALLVPSVAEADRHRSPERGRRSTYERSGRSHGRYERDHSRRSYRGGHARHSYRRGRDSYKRGHYRSAPRYRRPSYRPRHPGYSRPYHRPYYRSPYYYGSRPYPRQYYAPRPAPYGYPGPAYGPWPPHRGGVHGSVSIGLPFIGFSLHF